MCCWRGISCRMQYGWGSGVKRRYYGFFFIFIFCHHLYGVIGCMGRTGYCKCKYIESIANSQAINRNSASTGHHSAAPALTLAY